MFPEAVILFHQAAADTRILTDAEQEASSLNSLNFVFMRLGEHAQAQEFQLQVLALQECLQDPRGHALCLDSLARIHLRIGQPQGALEALHAGLNLARQAGEWRTVTVLLGTLRKLEHQSGHQQLAQTLLQEGLVLAGQLGDALTQVDMLTIISISQVQSEHELQGLMAALQTQDRALELCGTTGFSAARVLLLHRGKVRRSTDPQAAEVALRQMLTEAETFSLQMEARDLNLRLMEVCRQTGRYQEALDHRVRYHALHQQLYGEEQDHRAPALLIIHQVGRERKLAASFQALNTELLETNTVLAQASADKERLLDQVRHQALHDPLTGLPNRALLRIKMEDVVTQAAESGEVFAVMYIDLDGRKAVNDTYGHALGDQLLIKVAYRLKRYLRRDDLMARLGGDEFTVIARHLTSSQTARLIVQKLPELLSTRYPLEKHYIEVGASIGVSLYPHHGLDAATLQHQTDVAMTLVK